MPNMLENVQVKGLTRISNTLEETGYEKEICKIIWEKFLSISHDVLALLVPILTCLFVWHF